MEMQFVAVCLQSPKSVITYAQVRGKWGKSIRYIVSPI